MDVSVETTGALSRRLEFTIPVGDVEALFSARLQRMRKTVRLDGFRPGKVPISVVRERFGLRVFREVASELMESSYRRAVAEHGLTPAGEPDFNVAEIQPGQDVQFTVDVELYPEFTPAPLQGVKVEKPVAEIRDADVDEMIRRLRLGRAEWRPVTRAAQDGDRVRIHFKKKVEVFDIDDRDELALILGSASGIAGELAQQLLKSKCGDVKKIKLRIPKDYPLTGSAGKKLKFKVEVREIEESVLPPLDQDFFKRCGVEEGGLEALKKVLKEGMEYELKGKLQSSLRKRVLDVLLERNEIEAPERMVRRETERIKSDMIARLGGEGDPPELRDDLLKEQALRRVKLGIIMNKIAELNEIDVEEPEFEAEVEKAVAAYADPEAAARHYRTDRRARSALVGAMLEEKVFRWVLEQVRIEEKTCTFKEVMSSEAA